jgi:hypothetical protein
VFAAMVLASSATALGAEAEKVDFDRDVLPILSAQCFSCHGPDAGRRKADLRLDVRGAAVAEREGVPAIVPGQPDESELIARITSDDATDRMPPPKAGPRLSPEQIRTIRKWVEQGAEYAEHWAFVPPRRPPLPRVREADWPRSPIDTFILDRLEREELGHADRASREALIRRATLDLLGLPPTPEEIRAFLDDESPRADELLIERLLASPHYGERWGRHWLDVVRYADSGGFETDVFFGHAWRYRDYVIRSFNADTPFDRFLREQVAGDELGTGDEDALIATGLYTIAPALTESAMVPGKLEYDLLIDAVDTTGSAFLGLTIGCARCHDHKYDPISQRDYFRLQALFAASEPVDRLPDGTRTNRDGRVAIRNTLQEFGIEQAKASARRETRPEVRGAYLRQVGDFFIRTDGSLQRRVEQSRRYLALQPHVERCREALNSGTTDDDGAGASDVGARPREAREELLAALGRRALELAARGDPAARAYRALATEEERRRFLIDLGAKGLESKRPDDLIEDLDGFRMALGARHLDGRSEIPDRILAHRAQPYETRVLRRGELESPGEVVGPGLPAQLDGGRAIGDLPPTRWRTALADWLASAQNPLTARVLVNRVWQWHFGVGLVPTPNDFGIRGERPSHPELLDWLAVEFVEHGWSLKHLHRLIMLSSTYQMSARADREAIARDPDNRLLTRYQPRRLEAEVLWDSLRAVAGTLDRSVYGLPFAPPLDEQEQIGNYNTQKWPASPPERSHRRAVYLLVRRSFRFPMLSAFDPPDTVSSCGRRDITTVPNQALTLLNSRTIREQAAAFAGRLLRESNRAPEAVADLAWGYAYGRRITDGERRKVVEFLRARRQADPDPSGDPLRRAVEELCLALFNTTEFIYIE